MINNRQNGRRRGRGGQQARNGQPGTPDRGNRLDNRARGNAAQLLEKYKTLARDAQMQGDRVNTEYYLQFADHYFRVLSESRARFEEQRPARTSDNRDEFGDEDGGDNNSRNYQADQNGDDGWDDGDQQSAPEPQRSYAPRAERQDRTDRADRPERQDRTDRADRPERAERQSYQNDSGDEGRRGGGDRQSAPREGGSRERGNRETAGRDSGSRETAGRDEGPRDSSVRESAREDGAREAGPREGGRGRRNGNSNSAPASSNAVNGNGFAAPDFLTEPLTPRFEADRAPSSDQDTVASDDVVEAPAPKPRRTRRPRGETAPVEA